MSTPPLLNSPAVQTPPTSSTSNLPPTSQLQTPPIHQTTPSPAARLTPTPHQTPPPLPGNQTPQPQTPNSAILAPPTPQQQLDRANQMQPLGGGASEALSVPSQDVLGPNTRPQSLVSCSTLCLISKYLLAQCLSPKWFYWIITSTVLLVDLCVLCAIFAIALISTYV